MLDGLPKKPYRRETAIVNLDKSVGRGTHWVSYAIKDDIVVYFDSFGNLKPPTELIGYFLKGAQGHRRILYNYDSVQKYDTVVCGHLCLDFLYKVSLVLYGS